ncbi:MAG TPA: response regulator transcription factor [Burkholderiales bacterium]|jgi:DNA-binding NarL/FixJ family response regulator|nr:response regulator transcription factor [Burkholderiales bacterium]
MHLLLVDGHPMALEALGALAKGSFAGACVDSASGLNEALEKARDAPRVDLVLLDPRLPGCSGIDALLRLRAEFPALRVLVVSGDEDGDRVIAAMEAGAAGYALKTIKLPELTAVIRFVAEGGTYIPPKVLREVASRPAAREHRSRRPTGRQLEVLKQVAKGLSNKQIARILGISEGTVKQHMHDVCAMFGVSSRLEALGAATRLGVRLD